MQKLLILLSVLLALAACTNPNTPAQKSASTAEIPQTTGPDPSDLLKTLQGRWQSQGDSTYELEIIDTRMRHINSGKLGAETEIVVDGSCRNTGCPIDSTDLRDGWCFVEKGEFEAKCNIVITCDKETLKFTAIGVENGLRVFKKL